MPIKVVQKITAWSFSRLKDWEKCPQKAKFKHIEKIKETTVSEAMERGAKIDEACEHYLKDILKAVPTECASFDKEFKALKKKKPLYLQENWAFKADWSWLGVDGWFSKNAWVRIKMDASFLTKKVLTVIDFKTGKVYPEHQDQLELYAIGGFMRFPDAQVVKTNLWYTDLGTEDPKEFKLAQIPELKEKWHERVYPMLADTRFAPKPGGYCSYCPYTKSKGGPCQY